MNSESGYFAGRRLNGIVGAMCYISAVMSGLVFVMVPGELYVYGASRAWFVFGVLIALSLSWLVIPVKLNDYCIKTGTVSLPFFMSLRYKEKKPAVRRLIAVIVAGVMAVIGAGLVSDGAKALALFSGGRIGYEPAVFIIILTIMIYVIPFGFNGLNTVGTVGFVLMMLVFITIPVLIVIAMGGHGFVAGISSSRPGCTVSDFLNITKSGMDNIAISSVIGGLTRGMAYFVLPVLLLYYTTYKSEKKLLLSRRFSLSAVLVVMVSACVIGVMGRAFLAPKVYVSGEYPGMNIYREITEKLQHLGLMPAAVGVLMYTGLVLAYITTADKCIYLVTSTISDEICAGPGRRNKRLVYMLTGFIVLVLAAVASIVFRDKLKAWSEVSLELMAVTLGPVLMTSLYARRMNRAGVFAGVFAGALTLIVWKVTGIEEKTLINCMPAGFVINLIASAFASFITGGPGEEVDKEFEDVRYGLID